MWSLLESSQVRVPANHLILMAPQGDGAHKAPKSLKAFSPNGF